MIRLMESLIGMIYGYIGVTRISGYRHKYKGFGQKIGIPKVYK